MVTAPLPGTVENDSALVLPRSTAAAELGRAVDTSLPIAVELDTIPPFTPTVQPSTYPGEAYPGEAYPGAAVSIEAPNVARQALPMAVETDGASVGPGGVIAVYGDDGFGQGAFGTSPFGAATATTTTVPAGMRATGYAQPAVERDLGMPLTSLVSEGEFGAAITAVDRVPIYSLKVDWNRNGLYDHVLSDLTDLVEEVSVDKALSGSLPVEVGLVEGYSSAELSVKLSGRWHKPPDSFTDRINLALNPSVEISATGYTLVTTGTLATSVQRATTIAPPAGTYYLYIRPADNGTSGFTFIRCPLVRVTPGTTYTFSAYRNIVGALSSTFVGVDWMDGSGNQLSGTTVNGQQITGSGWQRGSVTATAPTGAVYARQFLVAGTVSFTNYVRWDAVLVEAGGLLGEYFDGDASGASWDGVAHASTSRILAESEADYEDSTADLVDVFGPYRSDSPLYGKPILKTPIYLETGFIAEDGPRLARRFTGVVTQVHPQSATRTVELKAADPAMLLRAPVSLPAVGMYESILTRVGPDSYRSRMNSQWLIDHALRRNGIYTSPPARTDAILSVTAHGSMAPEVGWGGAPDEFYLFFRGEMWAPGPFGGALAPANATYGRWWLDEQVTAAPGTGFGFSMWLRLFPPGAAPERYFYLDVTSDETYFVTFGIGDDGRPYLGTRRNLAGFQETATPAGWTPPNREVWKFIGVHVAFAATTMNVSFRLDGVTYTQNVFIQGRSSPWRPQPYIHYTFRTSVQNFQLWKSTTPPTGSWVGEDPNWVPQAFLDPGGNELTAIPEMIAQDSWELIKQVADAEGSTFQFDEFGKPWFRTAKGDEYYGRRPGPPEVISADRNLADLVSVTDESTIRNVINIKTKSLLIGDWEDYYSSPSLDAFDCEPVSTTYFDIDLPTAAYEIPPPLSTNGSLNNPGAYRYVGGDGFVYYNTNELWQASARQGNVKNYIRCMIVQRDAPTVWVVSSVQIRVVRLTPWRMQVIINNQNNFWIRFATLTKVSDSDTGQVVDDGEPALIIPAQLVKAKPEQLEVWTDNGSVAAYGASTFDVGGSDERWRQRPEGLRRLASEILATTANPVPVLDAVDTTHDPRRKLGDRVLLRDPRGMGEVLGSIAGLTQTYSSAGARDKITVRPLAPPGLGLLDDPTHGLLDASLVLGP